MQITDGEKEDVPPPDPLEEKKAKAASFKTRTASTITMIAGFLVMIYLGHVPLMFLVFTLQQWYFFFVATFYLYLRFIKNNLLVELTANKYMAAFAWLLKRHTIISYSLYMAGFVMFVLSLKRGMYLYQFGQYAWTHMILMIIFMPSSFFVSNIFEGLIWFLLPSALIITNDIMAYLAGFFFGRTPLIKLSPKKTWEGFIGGFIGTVISAAILANIMSHFKWMTCPRLDLSLGPLNCTPDYIYSPHTYTLQDLADLLPVPVVDMGKAAAAQLPGGLVTYLSELQVVGRPIEFHAMVMAVFASFVAPFGGFFGSGFKRAFKMKDFGDTIPGHGGVTDRFDCQMIMAMFAYLYYWNFVAQPQATVGQALEAALRLDHLQLLELWAKLGNVLLGEGLLPDHLEPSFKAALRRTAANNTIAMRLQPLLGF
eukprot:gene4661-4914_t